jgi:hypothetical protein
MALWYAVMENMEDSDWGFGSRDLVVAKAMAQNYNSDGGAYIVVIDDGADPVAVDEIHDIDITDEEIRETAEKLLDGDYDTEDRDIIQSEFYFSDDDMDRIIRMMDEIEEGRQTW